MSGLQFHACFPILGFSIIIDGILEHMSWEMELANQRGCICIAVALQNIHYIYLGAICKWNTYAVRIWGRQGVWKHTGRRGVISDVNLCTWIILVHDFLLRNRVGWRWCHSLLMLCYAVVVYVKNYRLNEYCRRTMCNVDVKMNL